jgi:hypothetical protein
MEKNELHPSVERFKQFVKRNPKVLEAVKKENITWQELYEEWYLLGEEDPRFAAYTGEVKNTEVAKKNTRVVESKTNEEEKKSDWLGQILGAVKRMDAQQLDTHINQLSQALAAIQGVLSQFQGPNQIKPVQKSDQPPNPFQFRKD